VVVVCFVLVLVGMGFLWGMRMVAGVVFCGIIMVQISPYLRAVP